MEKSDFFEIIRFEAVLSLRRALGAKLRKAVNAFTESRKRATIHRESSIFFRKK